MHPVLNLVHYQHANGGMATAGFDDGSLKVYNQIIPGSCLEWLLMYYTYRSGMLSND